MLEVRRAIKRTRPCENCRAGYLSDAEIGGRPILKAFEPMRYIITHLGKRYCFRCVPDELKDAAYMLLAMQE